MCTTNKRIAKTRTTSQPLFTEDKSYNVHIMIERDGHFEERIFTLPETAWFANMLLADWVSNEDVKNRLTEWTDV